MGILDIPGYSRAAADTRFTLAVFDTRLRRLQLGYAKRATQACSILCLGDSFTEGTGATSYTRRWQFYLQQQLRSLYQPVGVTGAALPYIPAMPNPGSTITDWPTSYTGSVTYKGWGGLGLRVAEIGSTGGSVTFTFTGTSAKLLYVKGTFGKMSVVVDGGAATVIDMFAGTAAGGAVYNITGLTAGAHTVVVSRDASSVAGRTVPVEGLLTFNGDEAAGIRVVDAGHHGLATSELTDSFNSTFWPGSVTATGPHAAIIIALGLNDATAPQTVTTFKANMQAIITKLRVTCGHTGFIGFVYWPLRSGTSDALWTSYGVAMQELAAADPDSKVIFVRGSIPDEGTSNADPTNLGLYDATNHLNNTGQAFVTDMIRRAIVP